jgi:radical SAM superfamily enzyme YgiQ (UPF0313 family)
MELRKRGVLLINPPASRGRSGRGAFFIPPMGLAYIAAVLLDKGIPVQILDSDPEGVYIDFHHPSKSAILQFRRKLKKLDFWPSIIGIGPCTTPFIDNSLALSIQAKDLFPDSLIVLGGPHVSVDAPKMAERMLQEFQDIGAIVVGEGERSMLVLFEAVRDGRPLSTVEGVVSRTASGIAYRYRKPMTGAQLERLPFPARNLLVNYSRKYRIAIRRTFSGVLSGSEKGNIGSPPFAVMFSSRGCPHKCAFCCSRKERSVRSARSVVQEMEKCIELYGIKSFIFYDDLFTTAARRELDRVLDISNKIIKKQLKVFWEIELRADVICSIPENVLHKMWEAGCCTINIGVEKGTESGLDFVRKGETLADFREAVKRLRAAGDFMINGTFMFGGKSETTADVMATICFAKELGLDYGSFYLLEIHPGTEVFKSAREEGLIDDILKPYLDSQAEYPVFISNELDFAALRELQKKAYQIFYINPEKLQSLHDKLGTLDVLVGQYCHIFEHCFNEHLEGGYDPYER